MKKKISIEGEGLAALQSIVGSASFTSRPEGRKIHALALCLIAPMKEYKAALASVQDTFAEKVVEGEEPNQKTKMVVPDDKAEAYQQAIEDARKVKYEVSFDRESFSLCNTLMDGLFERKEIKEQNGLSGVDQARNIDQISVALESAIDA